MKQLKIFTLCLLMIFVVVGCGTYQGQDTRNLDPYGDRMGARNIEPHGIGMGTRNIDRHTGRTGRNEIAFGDYRMNEEEQLNGQGQVDTRLDPAGSISNANTDIPSDQYPHTKAIQIQQAKYKFVVEGGKDKLANVKQKITDWRQGAAPATPEKETPEDQPQAPVEEPERAPAQQEQQPAQPAPEQQPTPAPTQEQQQQPAQPAEEQQQAETPAPTPTAEGISDIAQKVIELTNAERRKNGLPDYQADAPLTNVAQVKSDDMSQNNYFSHTSPTHGSPFDMIRDHGVSYRSAGENIAQGQRTPEQVVQAWMNSEGHRKNILSADFTHIGVGYNANGHYWTQMFIRK